MFETNPFEVFCGDAMTVINKLDVQIDCLVTSPPYYSQRHYGGNQQEIGQEKTITDYINSLIAVFKAVPLAPWGSMWINIGNKRGSKGELLGVTNHFVVAMMNAGYYLIDEVVWAKEIVKVDGESIGHTMIEPAPGRLNGNGWEPFYRFVRDPKKAWSDTCAVRIPRDNCPEAHRYRTTDLMAVETMIEGRNCTNVWSVGNSRKGNAHFAAYPAALVERPIAMTCPEWVTELGPRVRVVDQIEYDEKRGSKRIFGQYSLADQEILREDETTLTDEEKVKLETLRKKAGRMDTARTYIPKYPKTAGWTHSQLPAVPGVVLDPFCGTGTSGEVAVKLGRRFIGIDLYQEYVERTTQRCKSAYETLQYEQRSTSD